MHPSYARLVKTAVNIGSFIKFSSSIVYTIFMETAQYKGKP